VPLGSLRCLSKRFFISEGDFHFPHDSLGLRPAFASCLLPVLHP
jgi:hypothetical protein